MIQVKTFYAHNDLRNFSYLMLDDQSGDAWVIDPYEAGPLIDYIKKNSLVLKGILNTHQHFDHIRGNEALHTTFKAPITRLKGSEKLMIGGSPLLILDSPGHTMDHQVFVWQMTHQPWALFAGDTLFNAGVGNCKNGGNVESLYQTVEKLLQKLPEDTLLYPGHDYLIRNLEFALTLEKENKEIAHYLTRAQDEDPINRTLTTLAEEKLINPFMRLDSEELREMLDESDEMDLFKKIRSLRDKW